MGTSGLADRPHLPLDLAERGIVVRSHERGRDRWRHRVDGPADRRRRDVARTAGRGWSGRRTGRLSPRRPGRLADESSERALRGDWLGRRYRLLARHRPWTEPGPGHRQGSGGWLGPLEIHRDTGRFGRPEALLHRLDRRLVVPHLTECGVDVRGCPRIGRPDLGREQGVHGLVPGPPLQGEQRGLADGSLPAGPLPARSQDLGGFGPIRGVTRAHHASSLDDASAILLRLGMHPPVKRWRPEGVRTRAPARNPAQAGSSSSSSAPSRWTKAPCTGSSSSSGASPSRCTNRPCTGSSSWSCPA